MDTVGSLVASGGETARAILDRWGVTSLRMLGELEPGLPFAVTEDHKRALPVVTKAGGFGSSQTLVRCLQHLNTLERGTRTKQNA
jgi:4-hydroxythreonine-4-phosphate dehydrogenase